MARAREERGRPQQRSQQLPGEGSARAGQREAEDMQQQMRGAAERIEGAGIDIFTTWMQSQKAFSDSWLQAQSELVENWISATKNLQVSLFTLMTGEKDSGTKDEVSRMTDSWRAFMHDSYKVFNEGVVKVQEGWKTAFDKQMEITRDLARKGTEIVKMPRQGMEQQSERRPSQGQRQQQEQQAQA